VTLGSMRLYRRWLQRFRQMSSTMEGLKGVIGKMAGSGVAIVGDVVPLVG